VISAVNNFENDPDSSAFRSVWTTDREIAQVH
jgi:hypothetical protein